MNDPCPCGSGRKYKHCHGRRGEVVAAAATGPSAAPIAAALAAADRALAAGELRAAHDAYLAVVEREPDNVDALVGMALVALGASDADASAFYHARLAALQPRHGRAQLVLGNHYALQYDFVRARLSYRSAVALAPNLSGAWNNLGIVEQCLGNFEQAVACYDRAVATDPTNARLHSDVLISLHYDPFLSHDEIFRRHVEWATRHAAPLYPAASRWPNEADPERRLRIGYVSNGFDGRVVGHFLRNVLPHHDAEGFETFAYSNAASADELTDFIRQSVHHWREIRSLSDEAVATQVRRDRIDVLVDLDGHAPGSRLLVFARKPAPVQIAWLDYFDTTGLATIDYLITDPITTPEGHPQRFSETLLRLPETRLCYGPPPYAPAVAPLPCRSGAPFTFGSFNRYDKLGPGVIDCWARILRRAPDARLVIKNAAIAIAGARTALLRQFVDRGVAAERIELRPRSPHAAMLAEYGDIDLALDTFPYNGGLTTCEALWMGVPMVALEGERMIARQTAAMLRVLGREEFIAPTLDEYVEIAVRLAVDPSQLAAVRATLRERMRESPLCDGPRFTHHLERAMRAAWRVFCQRAADGSP